MVSRLLSHVAFDHNIEHKLPPIFAAEVLFFIQPTAYVLMIKIHELLRSGYAYLSWKDVLYTGLAMI